MSSNDKKSTREENIQRTFEALERACATFKEHINMPQSVTRAVSASTVKTLAEVLDDLCVPKPKKRKP